MNNLNKRKTQEKTIVKKCHCCGQILESNTEVQKCLSCGKSFLPSSYFEKIHDNKDYKFKDLFSHSSDLHEDDLIKGLYVLW